MKKVYKSIIGALLLVLGVFALYYFGLAHYFSLESVKANAAYLQEKVAQNYIRSVGIFIGISTLLIMFALPIIAPMGVVAGFLFSLWPAVLYCMIATVIGASISFLSIRYALAQFMKNRYSDRLSRFNTRMQKNGFSYLITLQLLTVVPNFIINTLAALGGISFSMFVFTVIIGSFPIVTIYAFAGRQLDKIHSWKDILSKEMLFVLLLLAGLALLPMLIQRWRGRSIEVDDV